MNLDLPSCISPWLSRGGMFHSVTDTYRSRVCATPFSPKMLLYTRMRLLKNTGSDHVIEQLADSQEPGSFFNAISTSFSVFAFTELRADAAVHLSA